MELKGVEYKLQTIVQKNVTKRETTQEKKLCNLRTQQSHTDKEEKKFLPNIVHNFSTHNLTDDERKALAFGLDHYIPDGIDKRRLEVEFEDFLSKNLMELKRYTRGIETKLKNELFEYLPEV